ncbi:hypothetical protein OVY01_18020 [Robbsia sp. Bb-Pol-6]|uniref:Lipoprotein n=1 Tax=Robbsia betulipollinis TaxID=2981849 RepID=A0ABT3ZR74_9BURK|nr:hypothetical protein [Robbsia betulipollinis]MCY0389053.1 hypothetical protein [Robbsia betulipollinis]
MKNGLFWGIGLLVLAGCSSAPPLFTADGRPTMQVSCNGGGDWSECERRAKVACGDGGYDELTRSIKSDQQTLYLACRRSATTY